MVVTHGFTAAVVLCFAQPAAEFLSSSQQMASCSVLRTDAAYIGITISVPQTGAQQLPGSGTWMVCPPRVLQHVVLNPQSAHLLDRYVYWWPLPIPQCASQETAAVRRTQL